jgi:hypothetical protein
MDIRRLGNLGRRTHVDLLSAKTEHRIARSRNPDQTEQWKDRTVLPAKGDERARTRHSAAHEVQLVITRVEEPDAEATRIEFSMRRYRYGGSDRKSFP